MNSEKYVRKPFAVDAVQITADNINEVALWCQGEVKTNDKGDAYIKVRVHNPMNDRQTMGFVGDWVLYAGKGYKVYTDKAFQNSFEQSEVKSQNVFDQAQASV